MTWSDRLRGIPQKVEDKSVEFVENLQMTKIGPQYIAKLAEDEGVTFVEACRMCYGSEDEIVPKYSVGYKLCNPAFLMMVQTEDGKRTFRDKYLQYESERKVWDEEYASHDFKKEWKKEKKRQTRGKRKHVDEEGL